MNLQKKTGWLGTLLLSSKQTDPNELKKKLQDKIGELRSKRKATDDGKQATKRRRVESKEKGKNKKQKQKEDEEEEEKEEEEEENDEGEEEEQLMERDEASGNNIQYSTFSFDSGKPVPAYLSGSEKRKKRSIKKILQEVEEKQLLFDKIKDTEEGKKLIEKENWKKVLQKAEGIKVKDDPKLLKKTLKRKEKQKEKSSKAWKERTQQQLKEQQEKQRKRAENIRKHIQKRKEVRLKKLRKHRPGFEGRKNEMLNKE